MNPRQVITALLGISRCWAERLRYGGFRGETGAGAERKAGRGAGEAVIRSNFCSDGSTAAARGL